MMVCFVEVNRKEKEGFGVVDQSLLNLRGDSETFCGTKLLLFVKKGCSVEMQIMMQTELKWKGPRGQVAGFSRKHFTISKTQPYKALMKLQIEVE
jgi:hypothetical protein